MVREASSTSCSWLINALGAVGGIYGKGSQLYKLLHSGAIADITDVTQWSPLFIDVVALDLARRLCMPVLLTLL